LRMKMGARHVCTGAQDKSHVATLHYISFITSSHITTAISDSRNKKPM